MSLRLRQLAALAYATLLEGMQQPAALLLLLTCTLLTGLTPVFQFHSLGEEGRLARDSGLAFMLVFGLVLAATAASGTLAAEIDRGTAAAALSKPVPRPLFLAAKYLGVLGLVAVLWVSGLAATLLAERASEHFVESGDELGSRADRITTALALLGPAVALAVAGLLSYLRRARFGVAAYLGIPLALLAALVACGCYTRFGRLTWYHPDLNLRVPAAAVLILLALAMLAALAIALATRLRSGPTLAICALLLALGLTGDLWAGPGSTWCSWRGILGGLAPNLQHFWLCDALADNGRIPWHYVGAAAGYACTWSALALGAGTLALRNRDLG
jgi:ABC-type transport system involved in multi-copper enzyme maturation permease subunit